MFEWDGPCPLNGSATLWSGDWLQVIPSAKMGTMTARLPHKCVCSAELDPQGNHALSCRAHCGHFARRTLPWPMILPSVRSSPRIHHVSWSPGLSQTDEKRLDGVSLMPWTYGRYAILDLLRHFAGDPIASRCTVKNLKPRSLKSLGFHLLSFGTLHQWNRRKTTTRRSMSLLFFDSVSVSHLKWVTLFLSRNRFYINISLYVVRCSFCHIFVLYFDLK